MLDEDELQALADDIRDLGQLQPIVLDSSGRILDGRNRLRACELAEVEPEYITYSGTNPSATPCRSTSAAAACRKARPR